MTKYCGNHRRHFPLLFLSVTASARYPHSSIKCFLLKPPRRGVLESKRAWFANHLNANYIPTIRFLKLETYRRIKHGAQPDVYEE
ncbi:hypothetical protein F5887DRAFT_169302 [Amanita rubescens]|nr:hypothetical protein F5887DRAFT_169302 [Amanita rubescens]